MSFGERLRAQRERVRLTQGQVAEYEGIKSQYISKLELGINDPPTWHLLARLARRYECSADYLLGLAEEPVGGRALQADERALLAAWRALPSEQRAVLMELLQEPIAVGELLDLVTTLGRLNQRLGRVRIVGEADD